MAEIFQENIESMDWEPCKEYLSRDETVSKLTEKFNITSKTISEKFTNFS